MLSLLAGCSTWEMPEHPRAPLPLPPEIAARFAVPGPVVEESLVPLGGEDGVQFFRGRARAGDEVAEFTYLRPPGDAPRAFVLALPILAGGEDLMWIVANEFAQLGYAVAWTRRVGNAMKPGQRAPELDRLFRRSVVHNRIVLSWARRQDGIDPARIAAVGISTGGLLAAALAAVEPELAGAALCLAGADLPDLLLQSTEPRVARWREWRLAADGLGDLGLARELAREMTSDPLRLGAYVAAEQVLLVTADFDSVVPRRNQDLLWESLGRPERYSLPLGHYTAALALPAIVSRIDSFLDHRARVAGAGERLARR
jgi:dienelactone hydrolase